MAAVTAADACVQVLRRQLVEGIVHVVRRYVHNIALLCAWNWKPLCFHPFTSSDS